jgi:dihydrofolate reductase
MVISYLFPSDSDSISEKDISQSVPFSTFNSSTSRLRPLIAIVAMAKDRSIGRNGSIPWRLPEDMAHFKSTTMGHPIIMGRKTWESLPKRPLPGRRNIVISRNADYKAEGAEVFPAIEDAIAACELTESPVIIGGSQLYHSALPYCTELIITEIDTTIPDADTHFPDLDKNDWQMVSASEPSISKTGLLYRFVIYRRK